MQVSSVNLDTEIGPEEIFVTATAEHVFSATSSNAVTFTFPELDDHGSSAQRVMGVFPLDWDCAHLQTVRMTVSVREDDTVGDDHFTISPPAFQTDALPCDAMKAAALAGPPGEFSLPADASPTLLLMSGGEVAGSITIRTRLLVSVR